MAACLGLLELISLEEGAMWHDNSMV
jgi:hypothetical protein